MKSQEMPLGEQVDELKAEGEDRMMAAMVPRLEAMLSAVVNTATTLREKLTNRGPDAS